MNAAITVIVPGFDVAEYAIEALDSLRAQTLPDWVAILVDDASTDATGDVFAAAAASDPRFRLVRHDERRGLAAARNTGLAHVDTPYLGFLDADDVLAPTALERLVGVLEQTGSDFAVGAYVRLSPDATGGYAPGPVQPWVSAATDPARHGTTIDEHPEASGNIVAWSKVSRTDFWRRAGLRFPDGRLYEDQIVAQQMYSRARRFDTVPEVVVQWRERADGSSITQGKSALPVLRDYLAAMVEGLDVLDAAGHAAAVRSRVRLILAMDLPPLVEIARIHPDDAYRRALGAFTREVWSRGGAHTDLDERSSHLAGAALLL
ncbi:MULTISPECIES: glycosyltransferase family 2 protein [unclassified Microbacterium]|uniref:glycosyltransferase family 2 protein n=1 Tax=unclassified Microbacterium TaxID=2609290 RepID=UPI00214C978C|nr:MULTISPECIES: glycosyltransferase family 2 protein [unclassified Microbacterium]MCR2784425.1 glycosyltransferase family 2 protein [Microbacterium sp. zg.B96]MDL5350666.1 glycosyltransferase family 2 protein [Microbacterium sp. zg-YB36]WIM14760.1 glycosyltransferase family 2 protein [Microbacterium sp. zg-B96]